MIEVKNLIKRYGEHAAVDDLSFCVNKGEVVGFLGPNGAGKSTTMNIITGYIPATEGTVIVDGHDIMEEPQRVKRSIGYLPEIPPLYPDMRVKEYLLFVAQLKSVAKNEKAAMMDEIMEMTGIADRGNQLIKHLSKGYKQRVGLASAIMGYPEVIILDEPTVGLDPMQIIEIRDLIKKLSKDHTVILSSHILSEVSAVCDKVMIINKGKLVVSDTPDNLISHMQTSQAVTLLVKGEEETIKKAFATIEEKTKNINIASEEENLFKITVTGKGNEDIRETLFYTLADAKCPIIEMKTSTMSLEDIFLEVTKEDAVIQGVKEPGEDGQQLVEEESMEGDIEDASDL
ncbi:MAG: ABC transporter ATP-binding protein [Velocimicrobium sp.]